MEMWHGMIHERMIKCLEKNLNLKFMMFTVHADVHENSFTSVSKTFDL